MECYLSTDRPTLRYVTSARAVLVRYNQVFVMRSLDGTHILPEGRLRCGESPEQALHRDVMEETGWTLAETLPIGFMHLHHLTPKPVDHPYPYPGFIQMVYVAEAGFFSAEFENFDDYESQVFRGLREVNALPLRPGEKLFLEAVLQALQERGQRNRHK